MGLYDSDEARKVALDYLNQESDRVFVWDSEDMKYKEFPLNKLINSFNYRFNEGKILDEVRNYIENTYGEHYVGEFKDDPSNNIQVLDIWEHADGPEAVATSCKHTAMKYLQRYGKKQGKNIKDLYKAMHYLVLMMHFVQKANSDDNV